VGLKAGGRPGEAASRVFWCAKLFFAFIEIAFLQIRDSGCEAQLVCQRSEMC